MIAGGTSSDGHRGTLAQRAALSPFMLCNSKASLCVFSLFGLNLNFKVCSSQLWSFRRLAYTLLSTRGGAAGRVLNSERAEPAGLAKEEARHREAAPYRWLSTSLRGSRILRVNARFRYVLGFPRFSVLGSLREFTLVFFFGAF
jgi:hypothetical protein